MKLVKKQISSKTGRVPLYRAISKLGIASREEARTRILNGEVKVHGKTELDPMKMVNPDRAHIELSGKKISRSESRLILLHKPEGYLTTKRDPEGRPTIYDLLPPEFGSFHPVGRLDMHTSGVLFLTNSTRISHFLTDPKNGIPRVYIATVRGEVTPDELVSMEKGIEEDGELLKLDQSSLLKSSQRESRVRVVLHGGKYREIRRIFLAFQHEVIRLIRISYAGIELEDLKKGEWRELSTNSIESMV